MHPLLRWQSCALPSSLLDPTLPSSRKQDDMSGVRSLKALAAFIGLFAAVVLWKLIVPDETDALQWYTSGEFLREHMDSTPEFGIQSKLF